MVVVETEVVVGRSEVVDELLDTCRVVVGGLGNSEALVVVVVEVIDGSTVVVDVLEIMSDVVEDSTTEVVETCVEVTDETTDVVVSEVVVTEDDSEIVEEM